MILSPVSPVGIRAPRLKARNGRPVSFASSFSVLLANPGGDLILASERH